MAVSLSQLAHTHTHNSLTRSPTLVRYFETFDVISDVEVGMRAKMMDMFTKCASREERGEEGSIGVCVCVCL